MMSISRRWLALFSFSLALVFGHGCSCGVDAPGADAGDPVDRDSGVDPKPTEDGGQNEEDAGQNEEDAGVEPDAGGDTDAGVDPDAGDETDAGGDTDAGIDPDAGEETDAGDSDAGVDPDAGEDTDAGDSDAGGETDAGGDVDGGDPDAGVDAGVNAAPVIGSFTSSAANVDDPGEVTLTVVADDDDGDTLTYTYSVVGTPPAGLTLEPVGPTAEAATTVSFDGSVPRGSYTIQVLVSDGEDSVTGTVTVTVNNHAPAADAGGNVFVMPESPAATVTLTPVITDVDLGATPADTLTIGWTTGTLPDGVTFDSSNAMAPTLSVDRAVYQPNPAQAGLEIEATVTVTDDQGATANDLVTITVLDERGGHVDNTSSYSGTGPAGYCGSLAHPCNNIADAVANLASLRAIATAPNEILVATTALPYKPDATIVLEAGTALRCGFDATDLDPTTGEWLQTALEKTPLESTADVGIHVVNTLGSTDISLIEECDLAMVEQDTAAVDRVGILIDGAGATLLDNDIVGSTASSTSGVAVHVRGAGGGAVTLEDNDIEGGAAVDDIAGVLLEGRGATLTANRRIRGGVSGDRAGGVVVNGTHVLMTDNTEVVGGEAPFTVGLIIDGGVAGSILTGNRLIGSDAGGTTGFGAILRAGAALTDNELRSGPANAGVALWVNAAATVSLAGDALFGEGTVSATGLSVDADATVSVTTDADVSAFGTGTPPTAIGARVADGATLTVEGSALTAGNATLNSVGVQGDTDASSITLNGAQVVAGTATLGSSAGVSVVSGALTIGSSGVDDTAVASSITAGAAENGGSVGVSVDCGAGATQVAIEGAEVTAGTAAVSLGVHLKGCSGAKLDATVTGGVATQTENPETGTSAGLLLEGGDANATGGTYTGGEADVTSVGIAVEGARATLKLVEAYGGRVTPPEGATEAASAGIVLVDPAPGNQLLGVLAKGDEVGAATLSHSFGVVVVSEVGGTTVQDLSIQETTLLVDTLETTVPSTLTGGPAEGRSAGLWIEPPHGNLVVTGSSLAGDAAGSSGGLVLRSGGSGARIVDNLTISGGAATDQASIDDTAALSVGVWMGACHGCSIQRNRIVGGSVDALTGRSIGLRANSGALTATTYVANNAIEAGDAFVARGLELSGDAGATLRVLHNNVFGGGSGEVGSSSAAVHMGQVPPASGGLNGRHVVASFGGNIIDAGIGDTRVGFWETCVDHGAVAHTVGPEEARDSNFWPNVGAAADVVYVRDASAVGNVITGQSCGSTDIQDIAVVNVATDYAAAGGACTSQSYDREPGFVDGRDIDGLVRAGTHLSASSPLRNGAPGTYADGDCDALGPLWENLADMTDFDGEARPNPVGEALDIGADEVP